MATNDLKLATLQTLPDHEGGGSWSHYQEPCVKSLDLGKHEHRLIVAGTGPGFHASKQCFHKDSNRFLALARADVPTDAHCPNKGHNVRRSRKRYIFANLKKSTFQFFYIFYSKIREVDLTFIHRDLD